MGMGFIIWVTIIVWFIQGIMYEPLTKVYCSYFLTNDIKWEVVYSYDDYFVVSGTREDVFIEQDNEYHTGEFVIKKEDCYYLEPDDARYKSMIRYHKRHIE